MYWRKVKTYFCIYNFFVCSIILLCSRSRVILCEEMSFFNEIKGEGIRSYSRYFYERMEFLHFSKF